MEKCMFMRAGYIQWKFRVCLGKDSQIVFAHNGNFLARRSVYV